MSKWIRIVLALVLAACSGLSVAVDGKVGSLGEARTAVERNPEKHILVFYKNYRS